MRVLQFTLTLAAAAALVPSPGSIGRRALLRKAAVVVPVVAAALPAYAAGSKAATKASVVADGTAAFSSIRKGMAPQLAEVAALVKAKQYEEASERLAEAPLSKFQDTALVVVKSEIFSAEDTVAIGTIRRYGIAADVIFGLNGLAAALEEEEPSAKALEKQSKLATQAMSEILQIGALYGL